MSGPCLNRKLGSDERRQIANAFQFLEIDQLELFFTLDVANYDVQIGRLLFLSVKSSAIGLLFLHEFIIDPIQGPGRNEQRDAKVPANLVKDAQKAFFILELVLVMENGNVLDL